MGSTKALELFREPTYIRSSSTPYTWTRGVEDVIVVGHFENSSTNNHWYRDHQKGETFDRGSSWTAFSSHIEVPKIRLDITCQVTGTYYPWQSYRGPVFVHTAEHMGALDFQNFDMGGSTELDLIGLGATAISKVLPTNPISDLPTAVGEFFSEGLPNAIGRQLLRRGGVTPQALSGEYLNYSFGIKPLLSDMRDFAYAARRAEKLIDEYAARAGKKLRRRYEFPTYTDTSVVDWDTNGGYKCYLAGPAQSVMGGWFTPVLGGWPGTRTDVNTRHKKTWFSGAFTYYLPGAGKDFSSRLLREEAEMRRLYGGISIDTAWNLLPYSWAADWITNAGDVIHNIAAFARDGLVMPWGYVMESCEFHSYRKVEGISLGHYHPDTTVPIPSTVDTTVDAKFLRRRKATPFGFGLSESGFTPRQWSILTALGISRGLR